MAINRIRISNFKSFKDLDIELGKFNVLIGANASGKSNFVQIFKFLRDIADYDLDNAISMQGSVKYLRNISIGPSRDFSLGVITDQDYGFRTEKNKKIIGTKVYELIYDFALRFRKRGPGFNISQDKARVKCEFFRLERLKAEFEPKETLGLGEISITSINGRPHLELDLPPHVPIEVDEFFPPFLKQQALRPKSLILDTPLPFMWQAEETFSKIAIYDFDPKLPKKAVPITGKATLDEDGGNLALVLKSVIEDTEKRRKLSNLIKDLLPFIEELDVERFADKSLLCKMREKYFRDEYLPASLISDGTLNVAGLIIALYFERKPITIIEEPERNVHPYLISKVVDMMKDASEKKQIIVTTHNPEMVRHAGLENILLVSRDKEGFSTIVRPGEKEEVKKFLQNEIGVEELYVQNLLEV